MTLGQRGEPNAAAGGRGGECSGRRAFLLALVLGLIGSRARAQDPRSTYLIKLLESSSQFRVRAQAAISLGAVQGSPGTTGALVAALSDNHPAVRAAAASSLGRLGDASAIPMLRRLERDPEEPVVSAARGSIAKLEVAARRETQQLSPRTAAVAPVAPSGPPQYYVSVAEPGTRVASVDRRALAAARAYIKQRVRQIDGVLLAPDSEDSHSAETVLKRQNLSGVSLDSSIVSVEKKSNGGTRVAVSVIVATYPGRDMRAVMQGAATVSGAGADAYDQALEGALSGALRQLPQALPKLQR